MSIQALTTFIEVTTADGSVQHRFQNSQVGTTINLDGVPYVYLSFIYQGATKTTAGDNLIATLILSANPISMSYAHEGVMNKWNLKVDTCLMDPETFTPKRKLTTEYWIASSMGYDATTVELELSSSLDAISAVTPNRVFTRGNVGELPTSSTIQAR